MFKIFDNLKGDFSRQIRFLKDFGVNAYYEN